MPLLTHRDAPAAESPKVEPVFEDIVTAQEVDCETPNWVAFCI
jgi:hypothetical protein